MIYVIFSVGLWVVSLIWYVIWNLNTKNRKLESMVGNQQYFITEIKNCMKIINETANMIDSKIWVQSDPEFLALMEAVKVMQARINQFIED